MELGKKIIKYLKRIIKFIKRNPIIKDFVLFCLVTIGFHQLYWNTNMNAWLFGPYTEEVFRFFTLIAFKGTEFLSNIFFTSPFDAVDSSIKFYTLNALQEKEYYCIMQVVADCSGIKQIFQVLMIMLVLPNKLWKRMIYFLCSIFVVLFFNIIRIVSLTSVLLNHPQSYECVHDWIGRPFHYIIIGLIWIIFLHFFARPKKR